MSREENAGNTTNSELDVLRGRLQELEAKVSELEFARTKLRTESSFREGVIRRAAEGICVCHAIAEYPFVRFTVWNPRMSEITGYSMDEINRLGWYQTMYPDPEIREKARTRMSEMRTGEDLLDERWEITRADLQTRILRISTSLLVTEDGESHALALMHDVTEEEKFREQLQEKLASLEKILPICASCKKIRDDQGTWQEVEAYIRDRSQFGFSHGICPQCREKLYPGLNK